MPIVKMDRVTVVGLQSDRSDVIEALMRLGAVDIDLTAVPPGAQNEQGMFGSNLAGAESINAGSMTFEMDELPPLMSRLQQVIAVCTKLHPVKKPMFSPKRTVSLTQFNGAGERWAEIISVLSRFEKAQTRIGEIDSQIVRLQSTADLLEPWSTLDVELSNQRSLKTRSYLGNFKTRAEYDLLDEALSDEAPESITQVLSEDESGLHVHVITLRIRESLVLANLRRLNFAFLPVREEAATPRELLDRILDQQISLRLNRELESGKMDEIASKLVDFEILHDHLQMLFDKHNVLFRLARTGQTFYLMGWVPSNLSSSVEKGLTKQYTIAFDSRAALPDETYPILLNNSKLIKPYEVVVEMFNPPLQSEVDPTPVLAPFYFLFFGMMLSDIGYGLILSIICGLALFKFKVSGNARAQFQMFFQCGLSAIFWGIMFGGFFGDILSVLTSGRIVLHPVLFDPIKNPTTLMLLSAAFGIIHLFTGMATKAYILIKSGKWLDAILDVFPWYFVIMGLILTIAGIGKPFSGYAAIIGSVVIVWFNARGTRNPLSRIGKGLFTLYGITAYLGDILSYMRILALVLATSVIAMVVNLIGFLGGPTFIGLIVFTLVALLGHTLNFALSTLSAYIHTLRLQFVEFFGKFYEGGGRLWKPQRLTARYVQIEREATFPVN